MQGGSCSEVKERQGWTMYRTIGFCLGMQLGSRIADPNITMLSIYSDIDSFVSSNALALNSEHSSFSFRESMSFLCLFRQQKNLSCSLSIYVSLAQLLSAMALAYALTLARSLFIWCCSFSRQSP